MIPAAFKHTKGGHQDHSNRSSLLSF